MKIVISINSENLSNYNKHQGVFNSRNDIKQYIQDQIDNDDDVIVVPECCDILSIITDNGEEL